MCIYIILNIYTHIYIGTGSPVNVQVMQDKHPATLFMTELLPALLTVRAVVEILAGQQLLCEYGPLYWGSNVVNAQGPVVFPLVYAHAHLTLPSHNPGQLVYMPLPLPPDDAIDDGDDVSAFRVPPVPPSSVTPLWICFKSGVTRSRTPRLISRSHQSNVSSLDVCLSHPRLLYFTSYTFLCRR